MKKGLFYLFLTLMLSVLVACGSSDVGTDEPAEETPAEEAPDGEEMDGEAEGETDATSDDQDTYLVATDNNYIPFEFLDNETGELVGFDIDLMQAIADEAGFNVEFEQMEFAGIIAAIASERFDMAIAGMTITEERAESIDFSEPYYDAGLILAVRADNEEIQSIDDVDGKVVATRSGSTSEDYLNSNTEATVEAFPEITEAYQNLLSGRADAALYDVPNVLYYADTETGGEITPVGDLLTGEQYGIAFPKGSELKAQVDEALATLMENGTYGDIYEEWFGERPEGM
ncbi:transporter substrate-binding domain-containing protein [Halalkalibacter nanhaiisediminis]|uniref:Amino acid ABC transporter substrate-binding protein, PAAT family (TC 3.A.1.3.-) n=1 Tax=Halalkalibacter nanhaiisediminis TaxID=688079 RepID=A0A562Q7F7_9BACI|nr:transporter substrate-binding domain-containing protein [Halalkalibacter nanhaiisediminis]TWI52659.1 amino acid ABC transporter substrate-binding protein, PAAT family (TC 3.A.1.3.-) [Halalkalibacter nanhaiisediminis]